MADTDAPSKPERIAVYGWRKYDIGTDALVLSTRMATLDAIKAAGGIAVEGPPRLVEPVVLSGEVDGMTARHFDVG